MLRFRSVYFILTVILFITEVIIALFVHDSIIRPYVGDFLVVILIYCFLRSFFNISVRKAALFTLLFSYLVEILQSYRIAEKLNLQHSDVATTIIGTSFSFVDLIMYTSGIVFVLSIENVFKKPFVKQEAN